MIICGLDECGRGSLAGPLVAAMVSFKIPATDLISQLSAPLRDSKKLTKPQRARINSQIDSLPILYFIESISVEDINTHGISWANTEVFNRLFLKLEADQYLVDGNIKFNNSNVLSVVHGDNLHPEIMLASIIAKEFRDNHMTNLHRDFPQYGWKNNMGYGSADHTSAITRYGVTPHHRTLFVRNFVNKLPTF